MSDVIITPNRGVATEGKIEFYSGATPALSGTIDISSGNIRILPEGSGTVQVGKAGNTTTIPGNLSITGNLTINGTTTTVNSTTITVDDPILTIGGDTAPTSDDNKDRGIAFQWHNGSAAKLGFFGYDDSTGKFTFIADATDTSDVFSGTTGEIDAKLDWSNVLNKPSIGTGTVTSVTGTSPVSVASGTTTPVISLASGYGDTQNPFASKTANFFLAAPNGTAGAPTFRAIVAADIPTLNQNTTGTAANVTGTVAIGNGGTGATSAPNARTNLGATTVGSNIFTLTNPSAITFLRVNADNTVTARSAADFRADIGAGTGNGSVTSVGGTGSVNGITLSGTVTGTGNLTLGGSLSGVSLTTQVTGTLPVANGGTGITSFGTGVATWLATPSSANLAAAVTGETGSGALVFGTNPTLGLPRFSSNVSVSAAGTTQGAATALTSDFNVVTSVTPGSAQGVRLPAGVAGIKVVVRNAAANTVNVYPETGAALDGFAANSPRGIIAGGIMEFIAVSSTQWYTYSSLLDAGTIKDPSFQIGSNPAFDFSTTVNTTKRSYKLPDSDADILTSVTSKTGSGNLVFATSPSLITPSLGAATATTINGLTVSTSTGTLTVANGKTLTVSNTLTFTGTDTSSVAFGTGGTVLYNGGALGTPSSGTLTNCTNIPVNQATGTLAVANGGTGITSFGSGVATWLATPSSANLAAAVTGETGSGALVFGTSPSLTTPALSGETFSTTNNVTAGTNSQGQGALTSDYNVITTAAATPSGVTLPTATTGRRIVVVNRGANTVFVYPATGGYIDGKAINTGIQLLSNSMMVFNASSTTQWYSSAFMEFENPQLGTAGAISINRVSITAPATSATLTIANGKTFTCSNTLTFTGTDSSSVAFGGGGTVAYTGNKLNVFAATTSSELAGVISDETGSGSLVFATSPTLVTPLLGTPTSGNLSNCTNIPVNQATGTLAVANGGTGITSFGTGVATFLGTPSSANLASALTTKTGTGDNVFGTSPTITTSLVAGSATMALFNTTATTINFGGAATTMTIGATGSGTVTIGYNLTVTNKLEATTKSFVINHPTKWKEGMKLRYACLEGPENGVYVRGSLTDEDTIELPEYWMNLVDENSITVNLTPIGSSNGHYVKSIKNNVVTVGSRSGNINCHYIVYGERKDVSKLVVEYHAA